MGLVLIVNGQNRAFSELGSPTNLLEVLGKMDMKSDRIAVELNGAIAPRASWSTISIRSGDRLEVVHFVGGGRSTVEATTIWGEN